MVSRFTRIHFFQTMTSLACAHILLFACPFATFGLNVISEPENALVSNNSAARTADGTALLLLPEAGGFELWISNLPYPQSASDFTTSAPLFGDNGRIRKHRPGNASLVVVGNEVHVVTGGVGDMNWSRTQAPPSSESEWTTLDLKVTGTVRIEDLVADAKGRTYAVFTAKRETQPNFVLGVAWVTESGIESKTLLETTEWIESPQGAVDESGKLQIVWSQSVLDPVVHSASFDPVSPGDAEIKPLWKGNHPDILAAGPKTFISAEKVEGSLYVEWWENGEFKGMESFNERAFYNPTLCRDYHGVVWLFAVDKDQRGLFQRRFLGTAFGPEQQCAGAPGRWLLSLGYSVQPSVLPSHEGFSILIGEYLSEEKYRYRFDGLPVPHYSIQDSRRVLFLDLQEIAMLEDLDQEVATAVRSDANPLDLHGGAGSADESWINYPTVLFDEGKFRMWYSTNPNTYERDHNIAYAESKDGIHWIKPELGIVEYNGSKNNNLLFPNVVDPTKPPTGYNAALTLIIRDDLEEDPERRYKMVLESAAFGGTSAYLSWSPDGIHWKVPPHRLWGKSLGPNKSIRGFHPWHEPLSSFFYDSITKHPDHRWKIYGQDGYAAYPNIDLRGVNRNMSLVYGPTPYDFMPYESNPVLDPRTGHEEIQIHGGMVQPYHGLYLCLYQHWWGKEWNVDLRLAVSRDGIHFARVHPDRAILPIGPHDAWDSGMVCTPNAIFTHEGKEWLYYRGSIGTLATGKALNEAAGKEPAFKEIGEYWRHGAGLARLREDGFGYLTVADMEYWPQPERLTEVPKFQMPTTGRALTIPIDAEGIAKRTLHVNVETFAPRVAWLKAQLRDAKTGEIIPGHEFLNCDRIEDGSLDHTLTWNGSESLAKVQAERIQIEFQLFGGLGSPRLFSFWFAED